MARNAAEYAGKGKVELVASIYSLFYLERERVPN